MQRPPAAFFALQDTRLQAVPMGAGSVRRWPQRAQQPELLAPLASFAQAVREPIQRFVGFTVARQKRFQRLHLGRLTGAGQRAIGGIGVDDTAFFVGDQRSVGMAVEKGAGKAVRLALRHHLDEADDRRHQEEDADHGEHAENAEHHLIVERGLEHHEGGGDADQHQRQKQDPHGGSRAPSTVHERFAKIVGLTGFRHVLPRIARRPSFVTNRRSRNQAPLPS